MKTTKSQKSPEENEPAKIERITIAGRTLNVSKWKLRQSAMLGSSLVQICMRVVGEISDPKLLFGMDLAKFFDDHEADLDQLIKIAAETLERDTENFASKAEALAFVEDLSVDEFIPLGRTILKQNIVPLAKMFGATNLIHVLRAGIAA